MAGKWLFLGCDSIIPVGIRLTNSDDTQYPYRIKTGRTLPEPAGTCGRGEMIIVRNIDGVVPGALSLAVEDSIDDSTRSYRTSTDTVRVVTIRTDSGLALEFASGSHRQFVKSGDYDDMLVIFVGDINKDGRIDFVIRWMNNYAARYDLFVSRKRKGVWQLDKDATILYTD